MARTGSSFTVRDNLGSWRGKVFQSHSPTIAKVEIIYSPKKVHKSKLYHVREDFQ